MIPLEALPALNAGLNALAGGLVATGYGFIRTRRVAAHRACMLSATGVSTLFLISYVYYHAHVGVTRFQGQGWIRTVYFTLLISHTILAVLIVPLVLITLFFALRSQLPRHRKIARWTLPTWLYVSVTGVVIYWMLYHLVPSVH